jgi:hypothetical protein
MIISYTRPPTAGNQAPDQRDQEQYNKDNEYNFGDTRSACRDTAKSEYRCYNRNNKKYNSPPQHEFVLLL